MSRSTQVNRFSIRSLFVAVTLLAIFVAVTRWLAVHTHLLPPVLVLGFLVVILIGPSAVEQLQGAGARFAIGCVALPMAYVFVAVIYSVIVLGLRFLMVPNW